MLSDEERAKVKTTIEQELKKLEEQMAILKEKTQPIEPDCSLGRLTREEAMNEQMMNKKVLSESTLRQTRLKNALKRIEHEMFGVCIVCEEPIALGRMLVRPESVRCVDCAV
jgi:DnaK suppressor protein